MVRDGSKGVGLSLLLHFLLATVSQGRHYAIDLPRPVDNAQPCQRRNLRLSTFLEDAKESGQTLLPQEAGRTLDEFVAEVKDALDKNMLDVRPINHLFSETAAFHPTCSGIWGDFGVAVGGTVNLAAEFRRAHCSVSCPYVHDFATFTGLPEFGDRIHTRVNGDIEEMGDNESFPEVKSNVNLVKGLFNETLPQFLTYQAEFAGSTDPVSYLHIDCASHLEARDVLRILAPRLVVGTVMVFDNFINYPDFKDNEMKAFWEWTAATGAKLLPIGALGPLPGTEMAMQLDWSEDDAEHSAVELDQSAAFVIAHIEPPEGATR